MYALINIAFTRVCCNSFLNLDSVYEELPKPEEYLLEKSPCTYASIICAFCKMYTININTLIDCEIWFENYMPVYNVEIALIRAAVLAELLSLCP